MKNIFASMLLIAFSATLSHARFARAPLRVPVSAPIAISVPKFETPIAASRHWTGLFDGINSLGVVPSPVNAADIPRPTRAVPQWQNMGPLVSHPSPPVPGKTALQKHVAFFDLNGDGIIEVSETRARLRQLGFSWAKSAVLSFGIHAGLAKSTSDSFWNLVRLRLSVDKMHLGIHAADTGIYDAQGYFVPKAFARIFANHAKTSPNFLTESEFQNMIEANSKRRPGRLGKFAAKQEFGLLLDIASDGTHGTQRTISRERMKRFYDGTLLYELVGER